MLNVSSTVASSSLEADCRDAERLLLKATDSNAGEGLKPIADFQLDQLRKGGAASASAFKGLRLRHNRGE